MSHDCTTPILVNPGTTVESGWLLGDRLPDELSNVEHQVRALVMLSSPYLADTDADDVVQPRARSSSLERFQLHG
jgi:hypothetical protein